MDLFTYLLGKKGQNTQRDLFSYLLGKGAGGSGTYVNFSGTSLNISNTLRARIKNITLKGATSQDGTPTPKAPIPIKVVTGDQNVNISSKNLFNKESITPNSWLLENGKVSTGRAGYSVSDFILITPNTAYYKTSNGSSRTKYYDKNKQPLNTTTYQDISIGGSAGTFTTPNNAYYLKVTINTSTSSLDTFMLNLGTTATDFVPYYNKDYPLSLGSMELAEILTYQDYIYGTPNNWYLHKEIKKLVLNGSENYRLSKNTTPYVFTRWIDDYMRTAEKIMYCNYFKSTENGTYSNMVNGETHFRYYNDSLFGLYFCTSDYSNTTDFKEWISTHNIIVYYVLATPTEEQITDTTLIEQLNNLYNATSQDGTTYITCSSASDSNEIIVFSGDIKVASVGLSNPLNTSLLSSNIQEEPNLDDVNETEDIEQNEEPIEEEVS